MPQVGGGFLTFGPGARFPVLPGAAGPIHCAGHSPRPCPNAKEFKHDHAYACQRCCSTPEYGEIVTKPVEALSVAYLTGTKILTKSHDYRIPILAADVTGGAVAEGAEIAPSDADLDELVVTPAKFAGLTIISRELADDSNPSATDQIGRSIARMIANHVDNALFNALASLIHPASLRWRAFLRLRPRSLTPTLTRSKRPFRSLRLPGDGSRLGLPALPRPLRLRSSRMRPVPTRRF